MAKPKVRWRLTISWALSISIVLSESRNPAAKEPALPDYSIYKRKDEVLREIEWIANRNPAIFKLEDIVAGNSEYNATLKVITVEPSGLTENNSEKIKLLLDFGEHGRELVTVEVALRVLDLLADPTRVEALTRRRGGNPEKMAALLERSVFKILPMENIHGREIVESGNLCERKNGRGVDSNRNWPVHWGVQEKDYDPSEEFPGSNPFSEPEVQVLDMLAKEFKPHIWMNMHSGMEALFMPYDHVAALPDDPAGIISFQLLQLLNSQKCGGRCAIGSGGKSVGYLAHGTATDYMHDILGVPFSFTWEIYGDTAADFNDCFRMFNPLTKESLEEVVSNWADAVLAMIELLPASGKLAQASTRFLSRKFRPDAVAGMGEQVYNHTMTDIAAGIRQARLAEIYSTISEVDRVLGLNQGSESSWDAQWDRLAGVPLLVWIIAASCIVLLFCFYAARLFGEDARIPFARRAGLLRRKRSSDVA